MNFEEWWAENASKEMPRPRKEAIRGVWETAARSEREACAKLCRAKKPRGNASDDLAAKLLEEAAREIESRGGLRTSSE